MTTAFGLGEDWGGFIPVIPGYLSTTLEPL
jgi:hypothetical protein